MHVFLQYEVALASLDESTPVEHLASVADHMQQFHILTDHKALLGTL